MFQYERFRESTEHLNDGETLRARLAEDGYLFLRGLLPRDAILAVRARLLNKAAEGGWLAPHLPGAVGVANPAAACVLHTHMPYATALTLLENGRLEMVEQNALRFHDDIAYDDTYNGLVVDTAEGDRLARVLGSKRVLFLANHGIIVVGPTVAEAFDSLYYLERACRLQVLARATGLAFRKVRPEVVRETCRLIAADTPKYAGAHFSALKRILDREEPAYSG